VTAPESEGLPEADTPAEVLGTMHFVLHSLGRELGERYDAQLTKSIGPNWPQALANIRKHYIHKYDAYFVLSEPLKFPDSPTRACLPSGGAFYNKLEDTLDVRNAWSHHEVAPLNLATLKTSIATIHDFATAAELQLGKLCSDIKKRINAITNGTYQTPGAAAVEPSTSVDELIEALAEARANEDALRQEVTAAQQLLEEAAGAGAANLALEERLEAMQKQFDQALEDKQKLEFVIEALADSENGSPDSPGEHVSATVGHPWPSDVPTRQVTMMSLYPDLFDPQTQQRVSLEFGPTAQATIASWKPNVAPNATVFLNSHGQAVTYINGVPIYLGSLGEGDNESRSTSKIAGFFISHSYTLRMNGTIEDRDTGDTLGDVNPGAAPDVSARLLTLVPTGGRLRVTTDNEIARSQDGAWTVICEIDPDKWFPGHLPEAP